MLDMFIANYVYEKKREYGTKKSCANLPQIRFLHGRKQEDFTRDSTF